MIELILPSLLVGLLLSVTAGPLGSFVVWGRMAYFGDTLAHSALLGVGLSLMFGLNLFAGVAVVTILVAVLMTLPSSQRYFANDTLLGIIAHGTLAGGLVMVSLAPNARVDMMALLFGDVLAVTMEDIPPIAIVCSLVCGALALGWNRLLGMIVSPELSAAEGVPVTRLRLLLMLLLALTVAVGMKVVGALLITALLIIPPAAARRLATSPENMAFMAGVIGCLAVISGLSLSFFANTPAGPSMVLSACVLFGILQTIASAKGQ